STIMPLLDLAFEHRMYLSLATVIVLGVVAGDALIRFLARRYSWTDSTRQRVAAVTLGVAVTLLGVRTIVRNEDYQSPKTMWEDVLDKRPGNIRAKINLAAFLGEKEETEELAFQMDRGALKLDIDDYIIFHNVAQYYWYNGQLDLAQE